MPYLFGVARYGENLRNRGHRSSCPEAFFKKDVLKNFAKLTENTCAGIPVNFVKFFNHFAEHLQTAASVGNITGKSNESLHKNIVVLTNLLVSKFYGNAQFLQSFKRIAQNSSETVCFHKIFTTRNLIKIRCLPSDSIILTGRL